MRYLILTLVVICIIGSACGKLSGRQSILKADPESRVILVAVMKGTDTVFKNALIDSLRSYYQPEYEVRKVVIGKAKELSNQSHRLLIVMDQLKAWLVMNGQTKALQKNTEADNVIFFMTAGDKKWQWKNQDIHHIASASEPSLLPQAWQQLKASADKILK